MLTVRIFYLTPSCRCVVCRLAAAVSNGFNRSVSGKNRMCLFIRRIRKIIKTGDELIIVRMSFESAILVPQTLYNVFEGAFLR